MHSFHLNLKGGVCLDLTKMNQILEINSDDFDCLVESGVTWRDLNAYLRDTGLWFPIGNFSKKLLSINMFFNYLIRSWSKCFTWWDGSYWCIRYKRCPIRYHETECT